MLVLRASENQFVKIILSLILTLTLVVAAGAQESPRFTIDTPTDLTSTCSGDSGGPLVAQAPGSAWIQVGITSTGPQNCTPAAPDYFTRVDSIQPWVEGWIAALGGTAAPTPPAPAPVTAVTPVVPVTPVTSVTPQIGIYTGTSSQPHGHLNLTDSSGGLVRLNVEFNLRCRHRRRGPYVQTRKWSTSNPLKLSVADGEWVFSTTYTTKRGWRVVISGAFPALGAATGTLVVTTPHGACTTGRVPWAASAA